MLKVDQSHKKANLSSIKNKLIYRRIASGIAALFISASLVVSSPRAYADDGYNLNTSIIEIDERVSIPEGNNKDILYNLLHKDKTESITIDDLQKLDTAYISLDEDIDWLKYCTSVSNLTLACKNASNLEKLKSINSSPTYQSVSLNCSGLELNEEHLSFLINSPNIQKLTLYANTYIKDGILPKMQSLDTIELMMNGYENRYELNVNSHDFKNIPNLKNIHIGEIFLQPYTLATVIEKEVLDKCKITPSEDIKIAFESRYKHYEKTYIEYLTDAVNQLDEIYKSIDINESMSDTEKLNKILIYVISNLTYDDQISYYQKNNIQHADESAEFYKLGSLYGALTKDSSICGNYSALFQALALRAGIDTYNVSGYTSESGLHGWNLVKINDEYYYVDATFLDTEPVAQEEKIEEKIDENHILYATCWKFLDEEEGTIAKIDMINTGNTDELNNYLINIDNSGRTVVSPPIDFELLNKDKEEQTILTSNTSEVSNENTINEEEAKDITNSKFKVIIDNKAYIIPSAAAIGFLSFAGLAIKARNRKQKKQNDYDYDQDSIFDYDYYDNYDQNSYNRSR